MSSIDRKINNISSLQTRFQSLKESLPTSSDFAEVARNTEFNDSVEEALDEINKSLELVDSELGELISVLNGYASDFDAIN